MLHCTKLSRYDFFDKVYSQRWQNLLSTAKGVSLYDDRSNLSDAEVVCTADYPFPIRSSEANYPSWDKKVIIPTMKNVTLRYFTCQEESLAISRPMMTERFVPSAFNTKGLMDIKQNPIKRLMPGDGQNLS